MPPLAPVTRTTALFSEDMFLFLSDGGELVVCVQMRVLGGSKGRVVDVPSRAAAIKGRRVDVVQVSARAQALDDVGVRQCEAAERGNVRQPSVNVIGDLLAAAPVSHHQDGRGPHLAQGPQQFVVPQVVDVQVREVKWSEFAYKVPVLCADRLDVALVDAPERECRRNVYPCAVRTDLLRHCAGNLHTSVLIKGNPSNSGGRWPRARGSPTVLSLQERGYDVVVNSRHALLVGEGTGLRLAEDGPVDPGMVQVAVARLDHELEGVSDAGSQREVYPACRGNLGYEVEVFELVFR